MKFIVHTDGGARGNPGPSAIGVVIEAVQGGIHTPVSSFGKTIGVATNNVAEYQGVIEALRHLRSSVQTLKKKNPEEKVEVQFHLDSTLVVQQLNGFFKVKDATLRELLSRVRILEQEVGGVIQYAYVPREQNRRADYLVNRALDEATR